MHFCTRGEKLMIYRKRRKFTKKELAKRLGISVSEITKYENNEKEAPPEIMIKMSEVLDVSIFNLEMGLVGKV